MTRRQIKSSSLLKGDSNAYDILYTTYDIIMPSKINSFIGATAAWLLSLFRKATAKPTAEDLSKAEFKTSTQGMGVRFSERIRDVFRFKWIKRH